MGTRVFPCSAWAASSLQKTVNTSHGTLDRNTLFHAQFLTGWQERLKRNKGRFIGKKRGGVWHRMRRRSEKKANGSGEKVC